jgi:hypothetical protein
MSIEYKSAQEQTKRLEKTIASYQTRVANFQAQLSAAAGNETLEREIRLRIFPFQRQIELLEGDLLVAREEERVALEMAGIDPSFTIKSPNAINESQTDRETSDAYQAPGNTPDPSEESSSSPSDSDKSETPADSTDGRSSVPKGAQPPTSKVASAQWAGAKDLRVFLRAPTSYLSSPLVSQLSEFGGILFPYTPSISYDNQVTYGSVNPIHSNYTQYFYKNSSVGNITVTGKFTVQNEKEAIIWLSIQHLLRALTKMRWGNDDQAGAPPPVCRLEGYGDFMLRNVPVVIASFKIDYPDNVDYISVNSGAFKTSLVPTISTISLTLNPSYSRKELQDFSVDAWLSGALKGKGYL